MAASRIGDSEIELRSFVYVNRTYEFRIFVKYEIDEQERESNVVKQEHTFQGTSNQENTCPIDLSKSTKKISAKGQTNWPDMIETLDSGKSDSPIAAYLPDDTKISAPVSGLPPEKAAWSGKWRGWAGNKTKGDARLVVEEVTDEGASIIYSFASNTVKPFAQRVQAEFVGNELQADLSSSVRVFYRMRKDGNIEFMWRKGKAWIIGILSKEP